MQRMQYRTIQRKTYRKTRKFKQDFSIILSLCRQHREFKMPLQTAA